MTDDQAVVDSVVAWLYKHTAPEKHKVRLTADSRRVAPGDVFVALKGAKVDGLSFIETVRQKGAAALLFEPREDVKASELSLPALAVPNLVRLTGKIASRFYSEPTARMRGVAITGTNGKTSTSHWVAALSDSLGQPCAAIGTIGAFLGRKKFDVPSLTTPDAASLQALFRDILDAGAESFAMEASSIGLHQGRMAGTHIETALFTNLTRDHLDYHKTLEAYEAAKAILFTWPGLKNAVLNGDDPAGVRYAELAQSHGIRTVVYQVCAGDSSQCPVSGSLSAYELLTAKDVLPCAHGMRFTATWQGKDYVVKSKALGNFNVSNLLGVAGVMLTLGFDPADVFSHLGELTPPAGRLQTVVIHDGKTRPLAVVDYAHTPDALEKAIDAVKGAAHARGGKVWVVFGAGGDRDPGKRPMMGRVAAQHADRVIVTSDNPRSEDPTAIALAVAAGVSDACLETEPCVIVDRKEAICEAIASADPCDIVLIAGKGHENYQEILGVKHHFDDVEVAREALAKYGISACHCQNDGQEKTSEEAK